MAAADGRVLYASPAFAPEELRRDIRSRNLVFAGSSNVLARADLLRRLGGFDESLHHIADWDLWIRLTEAGRPAACPEPLVAYVVHETNMHRTAIDSAASEGRLLRAKHAAQHAARPLRPVVFRGWIADGQAHSGRPGRAALTYAVHRAALPEPVRCSASGRAQRCALSASAARSRDPSSADARRTGWRCRP